MNAMAWPVRFPGTFVKVILAALIPLGAACGGSASPADHSQTQSQPLQSDYTYYDGANGPANQCTVDGVTMHCCGDQAYMIGARIDQNVFKCASSNFTLTGDVFTDPPPGSNTAYQCASINGTTMHCCPQKNGIATVMVGLRADRNILACQQVLNDFVGRDSLAVLDGNPPTEDNYPMHVCPPATPTGGAYGMQGINIDQNEFQCVN